MDPVALVIPAFVAGLLTFLAPCTLPLVPAYLGLISGTSVQEVARTHERRLRFRIFFSGLSFVLGFSLIFVTLGMFAGVFGAAFPGYRLWLSRAGGALVILFGLLMFGAVKVPFLSREHGLHVVARRGGGYPQAFLLGAAFGTGWTPCIGPVLGAVLTLAATSTGAATGALLLGVFALGLSVPFLAVALALGSADRAIMRATPYLPFVTRVSGALFVALGLLLLSGKTAMFNSYLYGTFSFINYGALLRFF